MIKFELNFPDVHYDRKKENNTQRKMRKYGLHASEVCILEEEGIL